MFPERLPCLSVINVLVLLYGVKCIEMTVCCDFLLYEVSWIVIIVAFQAASNKTEQDLLHCTQDVVGN